MTDRQVLIVTNERDLSADFVVLELEARGVPSVRFNAERGAAWNVEVRPGESWSLESETHSLHSSATAGVWWRRPEMPDHDSLSPEAQLAVDRQWRTILESMAEVDGPNWISQPSAIDSAELKARQLRVARDCGLRVPDTLWTNSAAAVRSFAVEHGGHAIVKSVATAYWEDAGSPNFVFAHRFQSDDIPSNASVAGCPIALQDEISPKKDVRLTVVGANTFAAVCRSAPTGDWRLHADAEWESADVPSDTRSACVELVSRLGIRFAGIDLLEDSDGEYWFIEANPNGEFGWLQSGVELPIAEAICDELLRGSR